MTLAAQWAAGLSAAVRAGRAVRGADRPPLLLWQAEALHLASAGKQPGRRLGHPPARLSHHRRGLRQLPAGHAVRGQQQHDHTAAHGGGWGPAAVAPDLHRPSVDRGHRLRRLQHLVRRPALVGPRLPPGARALRGPAGGALRRSGCGRRLAAGHAVPRARAHAPRERHAAHPRALLPHLARARQRGVAGSEARP